MVLAAAINVVLLVQVVVRMDVLEHVRVLALLAVALLVVLIVLVGV